MIDWHSFLQVKRLPLLSLKGPPIAALSAWHPATLQSGSSFTIERIDRVAPEDMKVTTMKSVLQSKRTQCVFCTVGIGMLPKGIHGLIKLHQQ